jgi:hypothetical protein
MQILSAAWLSRLRGFHPVVVCAAVRARVGWKVILLVSTASGACASLEGLGDLSVCNDHCGNPDATMVGPGMPEGEAGDDAPSPEDAPLTMADGDSGGGDEMDVGDVYSVPLDVVVPTDGALPDGTLPDCSQPPNDSAGVFVAPSGSDVLEGGSCGLTRSTPCKTIGAGLSSASTATGRSIVYVAAGTYTEKITLPNAITLQGGWHVGGEAGTDWTYDCTSPASVVTVQAPSTSNTTIVASTGTSTVTALTVLSKTPASAGQSLYGVFASGTSTKLTLNDVVIRVANAGDGASGTTGAAGASASATCGAGNGVSASGSGAAGAAAMAGGFASVGWVPGGGGTGGSGSAGDNGSAGGAGAAIPFGYCLQVGLNCMATIATCDGGQGLPGCAGGGGGGGSGGAGGGSSIALYAFGASVTVNGGSLTAGNGGKGGPGGSGGGGASGSAGKAGPTNQCITSFCGTPIPNICNPQAPPLQPYNYGDGGAPGGTGGNGSNGGPGGGGAGGDSYAVVTAGGGTVAFTGSPGLTAGTAGTGSGSGASGAQGAQAHF